MNYLLLLLFALIYGCGSNDVAGNSSETGNCKIVGVVSASSGSADSVPVVLLPADYTPQSTFVPDTVWSDNNGIYEFKNIEEGSWTVSVLDTTSQTAFVRQNIQLISGDSILLKDTLLEVGTIECILLNNSSATTISILGTPWNVTSSGEVSSLILDMVPTNDSISIAATQGDTTVIEQKIIVTAGDTTIVRTKDEALFIMTGSSSDYFAQWAGMTSREGFEPVAVYANEITSEDIDKAGLIIVNDSTGMPRNVQELLVNVEIPLIVTNPSLFPLFGLTNDIANDDYGYVNSSDFSTVTGPNFDHPLLREITRTISEGDTVYITSVDSIGWGVPLASAANLIVLAEEPGRSLFFAYDKGDSIVNGITPEKRIAFYIPTSNIGSDVLYLYIGALKWAGYRQ